MINNNYMCENLESHVSTQNVTTNTASPTEVNEPPILTTTIGKTTYKVRMHFSQTSTETLIDKVKRMLINDFNNVRK